MQGVRRGTRSLGEAEVGPSDASEGGRNLLDKRMCGSVTRPSNRTSARYSRERASLSATSAAEWPVRREPSSSP